MTKKTKLNIAKLLDLATGPSRWELDNITYSDRTSNPETLKAFLSRIQLLRISDADSAELKILEDLANDLDQKELSLIHI